MKRRIQPQFRYSDGRPRRPVWPSNWHSNSLPVRSSVARTSDHVAGTAANRASHTFKEVSVIWPKCGCQLELWTGAASLNNGGLAVS